MITLGQNRGRLHWQFRLNGLQREFIGLPDTRENRRGLHPKLNRLNLEWVNGSLDIAKEFPTVAARLGLTKRNPTVREYWDSYVATLEIGDAYRYDLGCLARRFLDPSPLARADHSHCDVDGVNTLDDSAAPNRAVRRRGTDAAKAHDAADERVHRSSEKRMATGQVVDRRGGLGSILLTDLKAGDIRAAIAGASIRRAVMWLQKMRAMYDAAMRDELVERNPARLVANPKDRRRREPMEPLSRDEVGKILKACEDGHRVASAEDQRTGRSPVPRPSTRDYNLIVTMLGTGARPGEALALRASDIDLKRARLVISGSIGRFGEGTTKNEGSRRVVDLTNRVAPVIATLRSQMKVPRLHGPLFANARGGFMRLDNWRDDRWRKILGDAKVPYRSPLVLRHTFAVRMLEEGADPVYLAGQMGHTSAQMIFRVYGRWTNREREAK